MVAYDSDRDKARAAFSLRLNSALDKVPECPKKRGRPKWLARRFGVTTTAAQKWLGGLSIPDQTNISRIAASLGVAASWLMSGDGAETVAIARDHFAAKLATVWGDLPDDVKGQIVSFALVQAATTLPDDDKKK
jgi:hypothetical protein